MAQRRGAQALRVGGVVGLALTALVIARVAAPRALTERADEGPSGVTSVPFSSASSAPRGRRRLARSLATPTDRPPAGTRRASEPADCRRRRRGNGNGNPAAHAGAPPRERRRCWRSPAPPPKAKALSVGGFPHDPFAFTQGLVFLAPDTLCESTGSVGGPSTVREVDLTTGAFAIVAS